MATILYAGVVEESGSITIPKEALSGLGVQPGDTVDVSANYRPSNEVGAQNGIAGESKTLADLLGDYIGCIEGNGESARNAGKQFTDHLIQKQRDGHL